MDKYCEWPCLLQRCEPPYPPKAPGEVLGEVPAGSGVLGKVLRRVLGKVLARVLGKVLVLLSSCTKRAGRTSTFLSTLPSTFPSTLRSTFPSTPSTSPGTLGGMGVRHLCSSQGHSQDKRLKPPFESPPLDFPDRSLTMQNTAFSEHQGLERKPWPRGKPPNCKNKRSAFFFER